MAPNRLGLWVFQLIEYRVEQNMSARRIQVRPIPQRKFTRRLRVKNQPFKRHIVQEAANAAPPSFNDLSMVAAFRPLPVDASEITGSWMQQYMSEIAPLK
jgi:hypothetical protein